MNCKARIIELPKILDGRGNLSFIEQRNHIPFEIRRTYWIYDVPGGESRGGHAYRRGEEFIVALSGGVDISVDDGTGPCTFSLTRSYYGLYVPRGCWREMTNFSTNSVVMILSSTPYDEADYIRDRDEFINLYRNGQLR
ncbi:MAG: FdtA/QdtA family cupin domain-containing protein [Clostridium sp.]|nr:FdtA/QdtA family cupin domain-containing protein [Clostridium sp.]